MSRNLPMAKEAPSYEWWSPTGPWWVVVDPWPTVCASFDRIEDAMVEFVRSAMPAPVSGTAYVTDDMGVVILCYVDRAWSGVRVGFEMLQASSIVNQDEVAVAAMAAAERQR